MPIIIIEGADGAGKTTLCMKYLDNICDSIYVHFPIRDIEKDLISKHISCNFELCKSLKDKTMLEIQDIILDNITANSHEMLRLHNEGVTVITDRYVYSNIVYRQLYKLTPAVFLPVIQQVLDVADIRILTENPEVLYQRVYERNANTNDTGIDAINEKKDNIKLANTLFGNLLTSNKLV